MDTDSALLARYARSRDPIAFSELTRRYRSLAFSAARRITGNHHDAEDVAQHCFIEMAKRADSITGSVAGWVHLQATNHAKNRLRSDVRRRRHEVKASGPEEKTAELSWELIGPVIDETIETLPDELRLTLILYYLQGYSQEQIAEASDVSQRTVSRRLQQGIDELRRRIGTLGLAVSVGVLSVLLKSNAIMACPDAMHASLVKIGMAGIGPGVNGGARPGARPSTSPIPAATWFATLLATKSWYAKVATACLLGVLLIVSAGLVSLATREAQSPYDVIHRNHAPHMAAEDPLAFPLKVWSLAWNEYQLWRGGKDLFYAWCATHASDWMSDTPAYGSAHGGLHLGNVGAFATANTSATVRFGLIDFDDAARLPFQLDLLQAAVTLDLAAHANNFTLSPARRGQLLRSMYDTYARSMEGSESAVAPTAEERAAMVSLAATVRTAVPYSVALDEYTDGSSFRSIAETARGKLRDVLRPADVGKAELVSALRQAMVNEPRLRALLRDPDLSHLGAAVKAVALQTQMNAGGSQGLRKYLVLLDDPFKGFGGDAILQVKQCMPSAAERAGLIPTDPRPAGQRVAESTGPSTYGAIPPSWCESEGESYVVRLLEPASSAIDPSQVRSYDELRAAARALGVALAATHRTGFDRQQVVSRLTPELQQTIADRAAAYVEHHHAQYAGLSADPRMVNDVRAAEQAIVRVGRHMTTTRSSNSGEHQ